MPPFCVVCADTTAGTNTAANAASRASLFMSKRVSSPESSRNVQRIVKALLAIQVSAHRGGDDHFDGRPDHEEYDDAHRMDAEHPHRDRRVEIGERPHNEPRANRCTRSGSEARPD